MNFRWFWQEIRKCFFIPHFLDVLYNVFISPLRSLKKNRRAVLDSYSIISTVFLLSLLFSTHYVFISHVRSLKKNKIVIEWWLTSAKRRVRRQFVQALRPVARSSPTCWPGPRRGKPSSRVQWGWPDFRGRLLRGSGWASVDTSLHLSEVSTEWGGSSRTFRLIRTRPNHQLVMEMVFG